ncbi:hypothetical protein [Ruegeria sp. ANG-R]|nr:hypothetical protein [Ruegeria sp. ANG-R]
MQSSDAPFSAAILWIALGFGDMIALIFSSIGILRQTQMYVALQFRDQ